MHNFDSRTIIGFQKKTLPDDVSLITLINM